MGQFLSDDDVGLGASAPAPAPAPAAPSGATTPARGGPVQFLPAASAPLLSDSDLGIGGDGPQGAQSAPFGLKPVGLAAGLADTPAGTAATGPALSGTQLADGWASHSDREPAYTPDQMRAARQEQYLGEMQQQPGATSAGTTFTRGVTRAVPLFDDLMAAGNTVVGYGADAVGLGHPNQAGMSFGDRYADNLDRERALDAAQDAAHPVASFVGQAGGALALPAGAAAKGIGWGEKLMDGATLGARYGAAYGFGQGEGLGDRVDKAVTGGALGAAGGVIAPVAVEAASMAAAPVRKIATTISGAMDPEALATQKAASALAADMKNGSAGMSPQDWMAANAAGQPVAVADAGGEATRSLARSSANTSADGRAALQALTNERYSTQAERLQDFTTGMFGSDLNNTTTTQALQAKARVQNKANYDAAYNDPAADSMWGPEFQQIAKAPVVEDAIRDAVRGVQNKTVAAGQTPIRVPFGLDAQGNLIPKTRPDGSTVTPSLAFWDQVQRNLKDTADSAFRGGKNEFGSDVSQLRQQLLSAMEDPVSGVPAFGAARTGAYKAFSAQDALEAGQNFGGLTKAGDITDQMAAIAKMRPAEKELFARGFASQLVQKAQNATGSRDVAAMFDSDAFRTKAAAALGQARADQMEAYLRTERMMTRLRTAVSGNSSTARQLIEAGVAGGLAGTAEGLHSGDVDWKTGVATAAGALLHHGMGKVSSNVAGRVGAMLASNDPALVNRAVQMFQQQPGWMSGLRSADTYLTQILAQREAPKNTMKVSDPAKFKRGGVVRVSRSPGAEAALKAALGIAQSR